MIGNLNEISLFTQAYFTMLTSIHESKNYQDSYQLYTRPAPRSPPAASRCWRTGPRCGGRTAGRAPAPYLQYQQWIISSMISTVYSIYRSFIYNIYSIYKPTPPPASSSIFSSMGWRMSGLARISCFSLSAAATILSLVMDTSIVLYSTVQLQCSTVHYRDHIVPGVRR